MSSKDQCFRLEEVNIFTDMKSWVSQDEIQGVGLYERLIEMKH